MEYTTLGRTGRQASVAGLGCGGHSRLGQTAGAPASQSEDVVRAALDLGITFIDTAPSYGTEEIVGNALFGRREDVLLSTKTHVARDGTPVQGQDFKAPEDIVRDLDASLKRLRTDHVDVYHLHGVMPDQYEHCREHIVPALEELRDAGKIRYLGITERFIYDPPHRMLERALRDDCWDVVMTGFNMINPSARDRVFARTLESGTATLVMFAVRRALSNPDALRDLIAGMVADGVIAADALAADDPLGFLTDQGGASSIVEAAYRFCRHEPGADIVLTGTGSVEHLRQNVSSILKPALSRRTVDRLADLFGSVDSVSGN